MSRLHVENRKSRSSGNSTPIILGIGIICKFLIVNLRLPQPADHTVVDIVTVCHSPAHVTLCVTTPECGIKHEYAAVSHRRLNEPQLDLIIRDCRSNPSWPPSKSLALPSHIAVQDGCVPAYEEHEAGPASHTFHPDEPWNVPFLRLIMSPCRIHVYVHPSS